MTTGPFDHGAYEDDAFGLNDPRYVGTVLTKKRPRQATRSPAATAPSAPARDLEPDPFDLIPVINDDEIEAPSRATTRAPVHTPERAPERETAQAPVHAPMQAPRPMDNQAPLAPQAPQLSRERAPEPIQTQAPAAPRPALQPAPIPPVETAVARPPMREPVRHAPMPTPSVGEPMIVVFQGVDHPTVAWDVNGFRLARPMARTAEQGRGRVIDVTLLLGGGVTRIEMRVQARAADAAADQPLAYVFVDLGRAQSEVLHRVVGSVMSRQALSLTSLLNETEQNLNARAQTNETSRRFRSTLQLGLAAAVVAVAGYMTLANLSAVNARFAAVTVAATSLPVPVAGMITQLAVRPGQGVTPGDVIGYVRPGDHEERLQALADRRRRLEAERVELFARRGAMDSLATISTGGLQTEQAAHERAVALAEQRLEIERQILSSLNASGLPTAERQRQRAGQQATVLRAESDLLRAQSALSDWQRGQSLAAMGQTGGTLRVDSAPEMMSLQLSQINDELAEIEARQQTAHLGQPILSPCACTVHELTRQTGEWARPEDGLGTLTTGGTATVHALILAEDARAISIGDPGRITLADGTTVSGRVTQLNYNPVWSGYAGLRADVFGLDRYARIEITPDHPLNAPVGMVAQASIETSGLLAQARSLVGL